MTAFDQSGSNPKTKATLLPPDHAGADSALHQHTYHSLGCCLRSNIFPGISPEWKSLSRDSYVRHPLTTWPADPYRWYGHRTDELVQWTEKNILDQKLKKLLTEREQKRSTK
nr:testis-expressed protein 33 [Nothobranchius furzeri]